jgi:predicted N-acetyltransferase YhbS
MKYNIRKIYKSEYHQTENLTRETFWNLYSPGCSEHLILHQLRNSKSYIEELDLVALYKDEIIGHIISTKAQVVDNIDNEHEVLCIGPIAVLGILQNKCIGTQLLNYSISKAKQIGFRGIILFGSPEYYHRFGFKNAKEYGITTKDGNNFDPFMALELQTGGFTNVAGRFFEDEAFETKNEELDEFEKMFPKKEKSKPIININN